MYAHTVRAYDGRDVCGWTAAAQVRPAPPDALLRRLRRMEGQVRGVQQMIMDNRSCLDEVQQICATTAALRQ